VLYKRESEELMDETLRKYFRELEQYSDLSKDENEIPFAEVLDKIVLTENPEAIPLLLKYFDDDSDSTFAMETLKCRVEDFPRDDYIPAFLKNMKSMYIEAKDWCYVLLSRIMNNPRGFFYLKNNIHLGDKETLLEMFDYMEKDKYRPERGPKIAELRKLLNQ
jgi:hypothetical protein